MDKDTIKSGFRLTHFELYNWGTYNNSIVKLELDKSNGLLTGDIGSGKSTIVDALTTLLVPHQKIVYNKAAGAETKERSLNSYILGEYKSSKDENFSQAKAVTLRESKDTFSVLLSNFKNDGFEEEVTIAQFFYITNNQVHKFFIVSKSLLSIKKDFFDFKDIRELKKNLRKLPYTQVYETFSDYSKNFRRLMGIKNEQALNLFYQTVSLKSIGNLTHFIRTHMLEPSTIDSKIDELTQNFSELNHIHNLVLRAKREIELLTPIDKDGKKYEKNSELKSKLVLSRDSLNVYFAMFKIELLNTKLNELNIEKTKRISQKEKAESSYKELDSTMLELNFELKYNGGDRLNSIDKEIFAIEKTITIKKDNNSIYNNLAKRLELLNVSNEHRFLKNLNQATQDFDDIKNKFDKFLNENMIDNVTLQKYVDSATELEIELVYLKNHRSNIPQNISKIRDDIAKNLNLKLSELPFVGELIEVKDSKWEGAIERVLHSFALSLLVDNKHYTKVSEYVNSTDLKGKLVYLKVDSQKKKDSFVDILNSSLLNKISIKASSPLFEPLKIMLDDRFNIPCVDNMEDFRRFKKALTINGQFKTNFSRHEKDDRFDINNSRRWILGWDNTTKLKKVEDDYNKELEKVEFLKNRIKHTSNEMQKVENLRDDLRDILKFKSFEEIDWYFYAKKIDELLDEKKELEKSSNVIEVIQSRIDFTQIKMDEQRELFTKLAEKIGGLKEKIQERELDLNGATLLVENSEFLDDVKRDIELYAKDVFSDKLNLVNIKTNETNLRNFIQTKISNLEKVLQRGLNTIVKDMSAFINEFQAESKDFDASIESLGEFRAKLKELKKDDLPKWEKRFKALFREKTIQNIVIVQTELEHQADEIKSKILKINDSLRDIEYNDGTYIELMAQKSISVDVREFIQNLKQSISGSIGDDNIYDEHKFLQIKEIIERLNGREGYSDVDKKWRKLVTDVRNWFDFSAMERYMSDGSEKEFYPHSGGKSGGQKEKLAYTVLASSLAFQFGLEYDTIRSRSFRFVMIDEAFGRGSDESSKYALRLFEKLNLQLLVITPKQKINIIEPFVNSVHFVHNKDGMNSTLLSMSIEEFIENKR